MFILAGCILCCAGKRGSQQMKLLEYSKLVPESIDHWISVDKGHVYDQETIYDYMNGAAEIYKQYSFESLYVRQYENPGNPGVTLEIFEMDQSPDAFGIFSHIRSGIEIGIGQGSDQSRGVINFWKGRYFIYIHADQETSDTQGVMLDLANYIDRNMTQTGTKPDILKLFPQQGLIESKVRYTRSFILLNMHYFIASENILNIDTKSEAVLASYQFGNEESYLMIVRYPSKELAIAAKNKFIQNYLPEATASLILQTENGKWTGASQKNEFLMILFDAPTEAQIGQLLASIPIP